MVRSLPASVLNRLKEQRRLPRALSPFAFIARNTCDASCEPVRQADAAQQQIPWRSRSRSAADDSIPSNEKLDVFGIRGAPAPFTYAPFTLSSTDFSNRLRNERMLHFPSSRYFAASSAAFSISPIVAAFSVPSPF